ncbi:MAG: transcriptional regulator [Flavobacteriales bacterium]|nr:transcriptional regulator [Flavobacteriales bacterium]
MLKKLDPLLHNELRLAIMSLLMTVDDAEFNYLLEKTESTRGNLSVQIQKLKNAGYLSVKKTFRGNYPLTICKIDPLGRAAFEEYVKTISTYFKGT